MLLLGRLENLERAEQALVDTHHGTGIVKLATVIGSTKEGDELALGKEFVSVLDDLVGSADEIHVVLLQEARHDIGAKRKRHTTIVFAPAGNVLVRIGPEEIAEETAVGNLCTGQWSARKLARQRA